MKQKVFLANLIEDEGAESETAHYDAHGHPLPLREPLHSDGLWDGGSVVKLRHDMSSVKGRLGLTD